MNPRITASFNTIEGQFQAMAEELKQHVLPEGRGSLDGIIEVFRHCLSGYRSSAERNAQLHEDFMRLCRDFEDLEEAQTRFQLRFILGAPDGYYEDF